MRFTYCALELTHREKRLDKLVDGACQRLVIAPPVGNPVGVETHFVLNP